MLPASDDIPLLPRAGIASCDLNWGKVRAEISRQFVNEEALSCSSLEDDQRGAVASAVSGTHMDLHRRKSTGGCIITLLSLLKGSRIESYH
jgi:hypothetical protein